MKQPQGLRARKDSFQLRVVVCVCGGEVRKELMEQLVSE